MKASLLFPSHIKMSQIDVPFILTINSREKLLSNGLMSQDNDNPNMDHLQPLPFPQIYPNISFDIIPCQFNTYEFMIYLGFCKDKAKSLYLKSFPNSETLPNKINLLKCCQNWIKECAKEYIDEDGISNLPILPDSDVGNFIMRDVMCLRNEVIMDINWLWIVSQQNPIMMQNYLDSYKGKISFNMLTLKDYIIEITKQRVEKLELFETDFQTYMREKTRQEEKKQKTEQGFEEMSEEIDNETVEKTTKEATIKKCTKKSKESKKKFKRSKKKKLKIKLPKIKPPNI